MNEIKVVYSIIATMFLVMIFWIFSLELRIDKIERHIIEMHQVDQPSPPNPPNTNVWKNRTSDYILFYCSMPHMIKLEHYQKVLLPRISTNIILLSN